MSALNTFMLTYQVETDTEQQKQSFIETITTPFVFTYPGDTEAVKIHWRPVKDGICEAKSQYSPDCIKVMTLKLMEQAQASIPGIRPKWITGKTSFDSVGNVA
eukprot:GILJ01015435.1.p1 GENE.GILJ01015435.1~~GILJ01015435.1.p1  ORF type:complete len:103 (-),score=8.76 GILJ01015435.1:391-699(-)